jgi:hypothetical protein
LQLQYIIFLPIVYSLLFLLYNQHLRKLNLNLCFKTTQYEIANHNNVTAQDLPDWLAWRPSQIFQLCLKMADCGFRHRLLLIGGNTPQAPVTSQRGLNACLVRRRLFGEAFARAGFGVSWGAVKAPASMAVIVRRVRLQKFIFEDAY